ncbi:MAG: hypothetical protein IGS50_23380 [Synechococcales cyanobacterium C42_A2020_086]|jgi:hypothetical protein|nr:hypothetical protein [Synechococcales cyanobacterium C42_A2020_086]
MLDISTFAGRLITLEDCWSFTLHRPKVFEEFIDYFLKHLLHLYWNHLPRSEEPEDYLNPFSKLTSAEHSKLTSAQQFEQ